MMSRPESERCPRQIRRSRWWRWPLWALAAACGLLLILLGGSAWVVQNLSRNWVKQRIVALVLKSGQVEIDYGHVAVSVLSGIEIDNIVVRSPAEVREFAAELLRIERLRVAWSPSALIGRRGPVVREVLARSITISVVADETGRTTFDAIPTSKEPSPSTPISKLSHELVTLSTCLQTVRLEDIRLSVVRTSRGRVVERDNLRGLGLVVRGAPPSSSARLVLALGRPDQAQLLTLERQREGAAKERAELALSLDAEIGADAAKLALDSRVVQQDFAPGYRLERLLQLDAEAMFNGSAGKTTVALKRADLGNGAARVEALLVIPDRGAPVLERARADADLVQLLSRLPAELVPLRLRHGELHGQVSHLAFEHPTADSTFAIDGKAEDAEIALPAGSVGLRATTFSLSGQPHAAGLEVQGKISLDGIRVACPGLTLQGTNWASSFAGQRSADGAYTGQGELQFAALDLGQPAAIALRGGRVAMDVRDTQVNPSSPLATHGAVTAEFSAAAVEGQSRGRVTATVPKISIHVQRAAAEPWTVSSDIRIGRLRLVNGGGRELLDAPVHAALRLKELIPDFDRIENSQGTGQFKFDVGALRSSVDATKRAGTVDFVLKAAAPKLGEIQPFLAADGPPRATLDQVSFEIQSKGRVARLLAREPSIEHQTLLRLSGLEYGKVAARAIALELKSSGTLVQHQLEADLRAEGVTLGHATAKDDHVTLSASIDRLKPALSVNLEEKGLSQIALRANLGFNRAQHAVTHDVSSRVSGLSAIMPLFADAKALAAVDWSKFEVALHTQGSVTGVVSDVRECGTLQWAPEPQLSWGGQSAVEVSVAHLDWDDGKRALRVPAATMRIGLHGEGERRSVVSDLHSGAMDLGFSSHWIKLLELHHHTSVTLDGGYDKGLMEWVQRLSIGTVEQNFLPMYPVGDVSLVSTVQRDAHGILKIGNLDVENRAAGTSLAIRGGLELFGDLPRFSLRTNLRQDLARASTQKDDFVGRGTATVELTVESPDLRVLHAEAQARLDDAHFKLPREGIVLDAVNGEVPIELDFVLERNGIELMHRTAVNPYMTHRFADQHPLLNHRSYLSIGSLKTPLVSIAPFAANLEIRQNSVTLSQLEMGLRGGTVTGNGVFGWDGPNSKLHADVRASGVQSSYGEPFDGNTSLVVELADHSIDGRADIVRIGPRHLLDLLDLLDPYHGDPGINRIRGALAYGYPKRVDIAFKHGFASAAVSFGGLAQLISVEKLRGVPVGPLLDRVIRSIDTEKKP